MPCSCSDYYFQKATITIYKNSFNILNGDKKSLPKFARGINITQINEQPAYSTFSKFLNGTGVHEGTHVINDIL
jgi:hypothetical protein